MRSGATRRLRIFFDGSLLIAAASAAGRSSDPLSTPVGVSAGTGGTTLAVASCTALWMSSNASKALSPAWSAVVAPPIASAMMPIRTSGTMIPRPPAPPSQPDHLGRPRGPPRAGGATGRHRGGGVGVGAGAAVNDGSGVTGAGVGGGALTGSALAGGVDQLHPMSASESSPFSRPNASRSLMRVILCGHEARVNPNLERGWELDLPALWGV